MSDNIMAERLRILKAKERRMKDKRTFKVWVWPGVEKEMEITGMALMHSKKPVTKRGIPSFQEATLTLSPKPKTKGKDKT